jgi:hypothetical protein
MRKMNQRNLIAQAMQNFKKKLNNIKEFKKKIRYIFEYLFY